MKTVAAVALLATGCSVIGVRGPPVPLPDTLTVPCTDTHLLPAVDVAVGVLGISGGGLYFAFDDHEPLTHVIANVGGAVAVLGAIYLVSAVIGVGRVGACRRAQDSFQAKELAARAENAALVRRHEDASALASHAATAAAAGDCTTVKLIEPQVRALEAEFHKAVFLANVAIQRCLAPAAIPEVDRSQTPRAP